MRKNLFITLAAFAAVILAVGAVPAATDDTQGQVLVRVATPPPPVPCLRLNGPLDVDFGVQPFAKRNQPNPSIVETGSHEVESCSTGRQSFSFFGPQMVTDADLPGPTVVWFLRQQATGPFVCNTGTPLNTYGMTVKSAGPDLELSDFTTNNFWVLAQPAEKASFQLALQMPCTGSDGAGRTMVAPVQVIAALS